jgi:predicted nucleotidyltransferase
MKETIRDKDQILNMITNNQEIIKGFGVSKIGLFGSYVRNEQNKKSDIDMIVQFEEGKKSYMGFINLADYLEDLFDKKVDLLTDKAISPYMKSRIKKEAIYVSINN